MAASQVPKEARGGVTSFHDRQNTQQHHDPSKKKHLSKGIAAKQKETSRQEEGLIRDGTLRQDVKEAMRQKRSEKSQGGV